jgi:glutaminase
MPLLLTTETLTSPLQDTLAALHCRFAPFAGGDVATYIPELGRANPEHFAICVATVDGELYATGDADVPFTIQSISKPFVYGLALDDRGVAAVLERIGVEPSGEAFNAISLEPGTGRPRNPMINAGAIATAALVTGRDSRDKMERTLAMLSGFAGHALEIDEAVYVSERDTGHRNRAIAYLLRNAEILGEDVDDVLDRYFQQCSVLVTASDLAMMAATLANGGQHPRTGHRVIDHEQVARVLSVMATCGMYDYAGSWLYRVGMPAKSGVAGGVIAVLPGQLGIGVFSPRLDEFGNSTRGVAVCEALSAEFGLHLLQPPVNPASAVMTSYTLADVSSKRRRPEADMAHLIERGDAVRVFRLQGPLVFSTAEVVLRRALAETAPPRTVVFDCRQVHSADTATVRLFNLFVAQVEADNGHVVFAGLREDNALSAGVSCQAGLSSFATIDLALEWCEEALLADARPAGPEQAESPLEGHPMLARLTAAETETVSAMASRREHGARDRIVHQGGVSDRVYLLTSGSVSVNLDLPGGERYRLATMGPGSVFGELALLDAERRSANVDAETEVVCYALRVADLPETVQSKLLSFLARDLAARLRRADREISALA